MLVIQSWDDGVADDEPLIALLKRYRARACFNLNPGLMADQARTLSWRYQDWYPVWRLSRAEAVTVYAGFEIAAHSHTHPDLTQLNPADLRAELTASKAALEAWFNRPVYGFCYPFGAYNATVQAAVRAAGFRFARGAEPAINALPPVDPLAMPPTCHVIDPEFWSRFEQVKAQNGVFYFWGHAYEIPVHLGWRGFEAMLCRLAHDPAVTWATVREVAGAFAD